MIQAANICTANGGINHPITKLYPLKVMASDIKSFSDANLDSVTSSVSQESPQLTTNKQVSTQPITRDAATRACQRLSEWCNILCGPQGCRELANRNRLCGSNMLNLLRHVIVVLGVC